MNDAGSVNDRAEDSFAFLSVEQRRKGEEEIVYLTQKHEEDRIMANTDDSGAAPHLLVVIDHKEAKVYRTEVHGAVPVSFAPYDPYGYKKHLHSAHEWTDGKRQPERKSFYEAIAKTLLEAKQVLLFGSGT